MKKQRGKAEILPSTHERTCSAIWKAAEWSTCSAINTPLSHSKSHRQMRHRSGIQCENEKQRETRTHKHWVRRLALSRLSRARGADLERMSETCMKCPSGLYLAHGLRFATVSVNVTSQYIGSLIGL